MPKELTAKQKEILRMLTVEFLTPKQIIQRLQVTKQAFYKIRKKLIEKGKLTIYLQQVDYSRGTQTSSQPIAENTGRTITNNYQAIRLHGQEFNIKLLGQSQAYQVRLAKSNLMVLDGNTVRLYRNSIEVYSGKSFFAPNPVQAESDSLAYWLTFFTRLEFELNTILVKPRASNIKIVKQHYAYLNSELAEMAQEKKENIKVYAAEDGKLAFITDASLGFKEDETVHPATAKQDRLAIDRYVNDWRLNPEAPTNSQLANLIYEMQKVTAHQVLINKQIMERLGKLQSP